MEYAIELLQNELNQELRALAISSELMRGNGFNFTNATMDAFFESKKLADKRIPDLEKAIKKLKTL